MIGASTLICDRHCCIESNRSRDLDEATPDPAEVRVLSRRLRNSNRCFKKSFHLRCWQKLDGLQAALITFWPDPVLAKAVTRNKRKMILLHLTQVILSNYWQKDYIRIIHCRFLVQNSDRHRLGLPCGKSH